jgi:hypothetical protein
LFQPLLPLGLLFKHDEDENNGKIISFSLEGLRGKDEGGRTDD